MKISEKIEVIISEEECSCSLFSSYYDGRAAPGSAHTNDEIMVDNTTGANPNLVENFEDLVENMCFSDDDFEHYLEDRYLKNYGAATFMGGGDGGSIIGSGAANMMSDAMAAMRRRMEALMNGFNSADAEGDEVDADHPLVLKRDVEAGILGPTIIPPNSEARKKPGRLSPLAWVLLVTGIVAVVSGGVVAAVVSTQSETGAASTADAANNDGVVVASGSEQDFLEEGMARRHGGIRIGGLPADDEDDDLLLDDEAFLDDFDAEDEDNLKLVGFKMAARKMMRTKRGRQWLLRNYYASSSDGGDGDDGGDGHDGGDGGSAGSGADINTEELSDEDVTALLEGLDEAQLEKIFRRSPMGKKFLRIARARLLARKAEKKENAGGEERGNTQVEHAGGEQEGDNNEVPEADPQEAASPPQPEVMSVEEAPQQEPKEAALPPQPKVEMEEMPVPEPQEAAPQPESEGQEEVSVLEPKEAAPQPEQTEVEHVPFSEPQEVAPQPEQPEAEEVSFPEPKEAAPQPESEGQDEVSVLEPKEAAPQPEQTEVEQVQADGSGDELIFLDECEDEVQQNIRDNYSSQIMLDKQGREVVKDSLLRRLGKFVRKNLKRLGTLAQEWFGRGPSEEPALTPIIPAQELFGGRDKLVAETETPSAAASSAEKPPSVPFLAGTPNKTAVPADKKGIPTTQSGGKAFKKENGRDVRVNFKMWLNNSEEFKGFKLNDEGNKKWKSFKEYVMAEYSKDTWEFGSTSDKKLDQKQVRKIKAPYAKSKIGVASENYRGKRGQNQTKKDDALLQFTHEVFDLVGQPAGAGLQEDVELRNAFTYWMNSWWRGEAKNEKRIF